MGERWVEWEVGGGGREVGRKRGSGEGARHRHRHLCGYTPPLLLLLAPPAIGPNRLSSAVLLILYPHNTPGTTPPLYYAPLVLHTPGIITIVTGRMLLDNKSKIDKPN